MRAQLAVILGGAEVDRAARLQADLAQLPRETFIGEGENWDAAVANAQTQIPEGALVLHVIDPDR